MIKTNEIIDVMKYIPTDHRGAGIECDKCGCHLALEKVAYQLKTNHGYIHVCEKCHQKLYMR